MDYEQPHARPIIFVLEMLEYIWEGGPIPEEWRFGTLCPIFKLKGENTDPKNWRSICLLNVTYIILATIIDERMNPHIRYDGMEEQCGYLKRKSCPDAVFPLKKAIQLRREHNLESYVVFIDLVKSFDTINHKLMILVLEKYGFPPKLRKTIERMYDKFALELKKVTKQRQ